MVIVTVFGLIVMTFGCWWKRRHLAPSSLSSCPGRLLGPLGLTQSSRGRGWWLTVDLVGGGNNSTCLSPVDVIVCVITVVMLVVVIFTVLMVMLVVFIF